MKTPSHHHPTTVPTPTITFDEKLATEVEDIRSARKMEGAYEMQPCNSYVQCKEEREEGRLAMEEFAGRSVYRFILQIMSDEYSVAGIVAAGIPEWMIQQSARVAIMALDYSILTQVGLKNEPKGKRSLAIPPCWALRPFRRR